MSDINHTAYVYALHPVNSLDYFYVGSTKHTPEHRLEQHIDRVRRGYTTKHMINKMRKVGLENVTVSILEVCTSETRWDREYYWIGKLAADGYRLANTLIIKPEYGISSNEYPLKLYHFEEMLNAYEFGLLRNDNPLHNQFAEVVERYSKHLITNYPEEFINQFEEMVLDNAHDEGTDEQTKALRERIFTLLERNRSGD